MNTFRRKDINTLLISNESAESADTRRLIAYSGDSEPECPTGLGKSSRNICMRFFLPNHVTPIVVQNREEFIVGRDNGSNKFVATVDLSPYDAGELGVSRQHAQIIYKDNCFYIEDCNSRNGTWLNYARIESQHPVPLAFGDIIRLGYLTIRVEVVIN